MTASKRHIEQWFDNGVARGATHLIVACDTFDYTNYIQYVMPEQDVRECVTGISAMPMQRVAEVYNLAMSKAAQLAQTCAFNYQEEHTP